MPTTNPKRTWELPNKLEALAAVSKEVFAWLADLLRGLTAKNVHKVKVEALKLLGIQETRTRKGERKP